MERLDGASQIAAGLNLIASSCDCHRFRWFVSGKSAHNDRFSAATAQWSGKRDSVSARKCAEGSLIRRSFQRAGLLATSALLSMEFQPIEVRRN